jgi:hypothetical protein
MSATDAVPNTATAPYSIYAFFPSGANPTYDLNGNMTFDGSMAQILISGMLKID